MDSINDIVSDIKDLIQRAQAQAVKAVEHHRVLLYWQIGQRIVEEEQQGKERADYGTYLIKNLSKGLEPEYGSNFSVRQLERSRQLYRTFPIASALRTQFNWTHYKLLLPLDNDHKRE
jgi:hypothetical protein